MIIDDNDDDDDDDDDNEGMLYTKSMHTASNSHEHVAINEL
jgi:hypothetical protein